MCINLGQSKFIIGNYNWHDGKILVNEIYSFDCFNYNMTSYFYLYKVQYSTNPQSRLLFDMSTIKYV